MRAPYILCGIVVIGALLCACAPETDSTPAAPLTPAALQKLAAADKADGSEDKLVSKCPACKLRMDGHAEHSTTLEGYTVRSCHADCAKALSADPEKILARLP